MRGVPRCCAYDLPKVLSATCQQTYGSAEQLPTPIRVRHCSAMCVFVCCRAWRLNALSAGPAGVQVTGGGAVQPRLGLSAPSGCDRGAATFLSKALSSSCQEPSAVGVAAPLSTQFVTAKAEPPYSATAA